MSYNARDGKPMMDFNLVCEDGHRFETLSEFISHWVGQTCAAPMAERKYCRKFLREIKGGKKRKR